MARKAPVFNPIKFNKDQLRDKIYACWIGKNIGGTMGTPYEGMQQINDIQGFVTEKGVVLPNDDLDLQLVWPQGHGRNGPRKREFQGAGRILDQLHRPLLERIRRG